MDLYDVMRTTPAVREFTDDPLPDEPCTGSSTTPGSRRAAATGRAPTWSWSRDQATREALAELNKPAVRRYVAQIDGRPEPVEQPEPPGPDGRGDRGDRACRSPSRRRCSPRPSVLVVCVDLGVVAATDQDLDRVGVISGASVYPLVWNILLAARNEGFGGTITTMAVAEEPAVKELLGIPEQYAVAAVVPLGKPVKQLTKLRRNPVEEFVTRERFDGEPFDRVNTAGGPRSCCSDVAEEVINPRFRHA